MSVSRSSESTTSPARPGSPRMEYRRLVRAGVNPRTAEILACRLYADAERRIAADVARYRDWDGQPVWARRAKRPTTCPDCGDTLQAKQYPRHRRIRHAEAL